MATSPSRTVELTLQIAAGDVLLRTWRQRVKSTGAAIPFPAGTIAFTTIRAVLGGEPLLRMGPAGWLDHQGDPLDGVITVDVAGGSVTHEVLPARTLSAALQALAEPDAVGIWAHTIVPGGDFDQRYDRFRGDVVVDPAIFDLDLLGEYY